MRNYSRTNINEKMPIKIITYRRRTTLMKVNRIDMLNPQTVTGLKES